MPNPNLTKPASISDCAKRLCELGYFPVPIPIGHKGPTLTGWQDLRLTPANVAQYFLDDPMLIGVLHVNVLAFDIDVTDPALAAEIVAEGIRRFPGALERIGRAPRSALILRMPEPGFKVSNTEKHSRTTEDGEVYEAQVEVRSQTRQIVAYGKHPDTDKPYTWPRGELWATPHTDLPEITQEAAALFRDWCNRRIREWAGANAPAPEVFSFADYRPQIATDDRPSEKEFLAALAYVPASLGHEAGWRETLMAIHDFYNGAQRGLDVAKDWSSADSRYNPREVEMKWRSFEPGKGVSYKAVFHHAKAHGCDLSALARAERVVTPAFTIDTGIAPTPAPAAPTAAPKPGALEWFGDIEPALHDAYLVKGVIGAGAMSVIYGPSNSGKTFFGLDMAFHIATGAPWNGRRVRQAAVLYLAAEGGRGVANRIVALKRERGVTDIPFALRRAGLDLLRTEADLQNVYNLAKEVKDNWPDLDLFIAIDTLSRVMAGGDENSAADMTALIRNIDAIREATQAHIMLVHHTGKDIAKGARGHSSLRAATDTEIEVQSEGNIRAAQVQKQRDYAGNETFPFTLKSVVLGIDQDGDEVTSCVVEPASGDDLQQARTKPTKNQRVLLDVFDELVAADLGRPNPGGPLMPEPGRFMVLDMPTFRAACEGKLTAKNARDAFLYAFDGLNRPGGQMCMASEMVWRTDRPRKGAKS